MTILYIILYAIGFISIWEMDRRSFRRRENANLPENIRKRIVLSIFSWVLLLPFLIISGIAWLIDGDNL